MTDLKKKIEAREFICFDSSDDYDSEDYCLEKRNITDAGWAWELNNKSSKMVHAIEAAPVLARIAELESQVSVLEAKLAKSVEQRDATNNAVIDKSIESKKYAEMTKRDLKSVLDAELAAVTIPEKGEG